MASVLRSARAFAARLVRGCVPVLALVVVATTFAPSRPAFAQGTSGQLPEPISAQDLTRYLDRYVRPNAAQWEKIDAFHEQYKADFKRLREGEIEAFLNESKKMQGGMPQRAALEEWTKNQKRLFGKIKALDNRLFDQVQGTLEETQVRALPRAKLARERSTYRNPMMMGMVGGLPVDLTDLVATLELSHEEQAAIDDALSTYETQVTKQLGELNDTTGNTIMSMIDAITAAGFGDVNNEDLMKDPEKMKAFMEVMQQSMKDATKKGRELNRDIAKLNNKTRKALAAKLPPDKALRLRRDFIARAYPFAGSSDFGTEAVLKLATRLKGVTDEQRAALKVAYESWLREDERIENELVDAMDDANQDRSPFQFGPGANDEVEKVAEKLREKRTEVGVAAINSAKSIIGPELAKKLENPAEAGADAFLAEDGAGGAGAAGDMVAATAEDAAGDTPPEVTNAAMANGGDIFIPAALPATTIATWSRRLGLDPGQKSILESLHADYLEQWNTRVQPKVQAIATAVGAAYQQPAEGKGDAPFQYRPPTESALDAVYAARSAAMDEVDKVEAGFIENVRLTVADDAHKSVFELLALQRALIAVSGAMGWMSFDGNQEGQANVAGVVVDAVDDEHLSAAAAVVLEHADELRKTTNDVRRATFENQKNAEKLSTRMQAAVKDDGAQLAAAVDYQKGIKQTQELLNTASAKRRDVVRKLMDELKQKLPEAQAVAIARGYNRAAFPTVYGDKRSAGTLIERARNLGDLGEQQTKDLAALDDEFMPAYEAIADKMVEIQREGANPIGGETADWQAWQERQNKIARLRFERDEVSMKAVRKLKQILTEEQIKRIPGLASYAQKGGHDGMPEIYDGE
ncbi:MAG: hypothetical protein U0575_07685 [Phycisphaerales bacterium]